MAVTVYFTSDSKRDNSTKQLNYSQSYYCTLKNGCSLLYPILFLEINSAVFPNYTGFKIEDRCYKIVDIQSVRNNLFEIHGAIDVLQTYKSAIISSTQFVSYSSHKS